MIEELYDVAVIGGGLCGFSCAVKAASEGRKVRPIRPAIPAGSQSSSTPKKATMI